MKMKQIKFAGAAMAAALMLLTSCLGDTGNSGEIHDQLGRVRYTNGKMLIDVPSMAETIYSPKLPLDYTEGDWMRVGFAYDYDSPENANSKANGYLNVTLLGAAKLSEGYITSSDTTQVMTNEIALIDGVYNFGHYLYSAFIEGDLLITSGYSGLTDQETNFLMYYDYNKEPHVSSGINGESVNTYTLYIRAIETAAGKTPEVTYLKSNYYTIESILN
jgi:hypothetical protein